MINPPDFVEMAAMCGVYFMPTLMLLSWYLCVEAYLHPKSYKQKGQERKERDSLDGKTAKSLVLRVC